MHDQQIGRLMLQANFGRTALGRPALFLAHHYRLMLALLTGGLLLAHLLLIDAPWIIVPAAALYGLYALVRLRLPAQYEERFYSPAIQLWRAQFGIAAVTALLFGLEWYGYTSTLWVLYLPALLLISRYRRRQSDYVLVTLEVIVLAVAARLFELQGQQLAPTRLLGEVGVRAFAIALPSFLVHYLARVDITAKRGAEARDRVVQLLLEHALFATDSAALGRALRDACAEAVAARASQIYLYDQPHDQLRPLTGDDPIAPALADLALAAARQRTIAEATLAHGRVRLAAPVYGQPNREGPVLAIVLLDLGTLSRYEQRAARVFLADLLDHIWPICAHANIQLQLLGALDSRAIYRLCLDDVLETALDTVCNRLGFSFATISLVDNDRQTITTVRGKNVDPGWVQLSRHALSSSDILADVLRTGQVEVIDRWDPRFDRKIWARYQHETMIRVWVPLGDSGVLEAGYYKHEKTEIGRLLIELLKHYARDIAVALQNAQYYEREQRHAQLMTRLHEVSYDLRLGRPTDDARTLLERIAGSALDLLGASIVLLYALNTHDSTFARPVQAGTIDGHRPLAPPDAHDNIVRHIAATRAPYYQPDVQSDARLIGGEGAPGAASKRRTFAGRQKIASFAGVPLLAHGQLLGVLCVNYRERHRFSKDDRQVVELFALQAAAIIATEALVRERERRRIEYDLHDAVKSSLRGLILFSRAASDALAHDPVRTGQHLHEVRRSAWNILSDVDIILKGLAPVGYDGAPLRDYLLAELYRLAGERMHMLSVQIDDNMPLQPLPVMSTLLLLIREATLNALEHASASAIIIQLGCTDDCVRLTVRDNGQGFDSATVSPTMHRGIVIMRDRMHMLGGTLDIHSQPGRGTLITGSLPLKEAEYGSG